MSRVRVPKDALREQLVMAADDKIRVARESAEDVPGWVTVALTLSGFATGWLIGGVIW